jgi:hypothetical protein
VEVRIAACVPLLAAGKILTTADRAAGGCPPPPCPPQHCRPLAAAADSCAVALRSSLRSTLSSGAQRGLALPAQVTVDRVVALEG